MNIEERLATNQSYYRQSAHRRKEKSSNLNDDFLFGLYSELEQVYGRDTCEHIVRKQNAAAIEKMLRQWRNLATQPSVVSANESIAPTGDPRIDAQTHIWTMHLANN